MDQGKKFEGNTCVTLGTPVRSALLDLTSGYRGYCACYHCAYGNCHYHSCSHYTCTSYHGENREKVAETGSNHCNTPGAPHEAQMVPSLAFRSWHRWSQTVQHVGAVSMTDHYHRQCDGQHGNLGNDREGSSILDWHKTLVRQC